MCQISTTKEGGGEVSTFHAPFTNENHLTYHVFQIVVRNKDSVWYKQLRIWSHKHAFSPGMKTGRSSEHTYRVCTGTPRGWDTYTPEHMKACIQVKSHPYTVERHSLAQESLSSETKATLHTKSLPLCPLQK